MRSYYFTFGQKYRSEDHPVLIGIDHNSIVMVKANNISEARDIMNWYTRDWAFLYPEDMLDTLLSLVPNNQKILSLLSCKDN